MFEALHDLAGNRSWQFDAIVRWEIETTAVGFLVQRHLAASAETNSNPQDKNCIFNYVQESK
jgi:hypothetical protein